MKERQMKRVKTEAHAKIITAVKNHKSRGVGGACHVKKTKGNVPKEMHYS
jgi:hypothetical protein